MKSGKGIIIAAVILVLGIAAIGAAVGPGENMQIVLNSLGLSNTNALPVKQAKGVNVPLYGGAIFRSMTSNSYANCDAISMTNAQGGTLHVVVNSGTGHWTIKTLSSNSTTGTFVPSFAVGTAETAFFQYTTSASRSFHVAGIKDHAIKLVPTLTGTSNATFYFTPSKD